MFINILHIIQKSKLIYVLFMTSVWESLNWKKLFENQLVFRKNFKQQNIKVKIEMQSKKRSILQVLQNCAK